jgi:hypothetical protein
MFAAYCGQYEECSCQHPNFRGPNGSDSWGWHNYYEERHPSCPLKQYSITIVAGE